jgi:hypothetical protein
MKTIKSFATLTVALVSSLAGCGGGLSTQEAYEVCGALEGDNPAITEEAFAECVACHENCEDCVAQGTSPETFVCPDD